jgi:hypothetical protein
MTLTPFSSRVDVAEHSYISTKCLFLRQDMSYDSKGFQRGFTMKTVFIALLLIAAGLPSKSSAQDYGLPIVVGKQANGAMASGLGPDGLSYALSPNNADGSDVTLSIGADVNTVVALAYSADLSGGDTEAQAVKWQRFATKYPIVYTDVVLEKRAHDAISRVFNQAMGITTIQVNLVMRTQDNNQPLQAHLTESFTCTTEVSTICENGEFSKLPGYTSTPWFKEQFRADFYRNAGK